MSAARAPGWLAGALARFAAHDWLVLGYLVCVNIGVYRGVPGPAQESAAARMGALLVWVAIGVTLCRGGVIGDGWFKAIAYRWTIYGPVQLSYFFFRDALPVVNPGALDRELLALDLALFGYEPALEWDRLVTPTANEWFSFFYFGYFFVLALHVIPLLFFSRNQRVLGEFALGMLAVVCIGQTVYMLVPGYGPYRAMADAFENELPAGAWFEAVKGAVASGGAIKDIFPSLHTALPAFIALFSFKNRALSPFRYTWPLVLFASTNIIGATLFLRWHYLIDVIAGLFLASATAWFVPVIIEHDLSRRARRALDPLWPEYTPRSRAG
jgi:hypothetical protein